MSETIQVLTKINIIMKKSTLFLAALTLLCACSKIDPTEAILGRWELVGSAMFERQYNKDNWGTTYEFLQDGTLRIRLGSGGGIMYGDPNRIYSYTFESGYLVFSMVEDGHGEPWKCKFSKNKLELIKVTPFDTGNLMIYVSNFLYFKRIY